MIELETIRQFVTGETNQARARLAEQLAQFERNVNRLGLAIQAAALPMPRHRNLLARDTGATARPGDTLTIDFSATTFVLHLERPKPADAGRLILIASRDGSTGTLELRGVECQIDPPNTTLTVSAIARMKRGLLCDGENYHSLVLQ